MPIDPAVPTNEIVDLVASPVGWPAISGFGTACPDALHLLNHEWVRCIARVSVSTEELRLVEEVLFEDPLYEPPDFATKANLAERRQRAEKLYWAEIGRLGRMRFLRPSEHGKHYSVAEPKFTGKKRSQFNTDLQETTIAELFWSWFNAMFQVEEEPKRSGPIEFTSKANSLWNDFRQGRTIKIAMDVVGEIGALNGVALHHVLIDLDLDAAVAHAYPVTEAEAQKLMGSLPILQVKSREY